MIGPTAFLILADEAATWRIAGLSQLDRLVLALNELAESHSPNEIIDTVIFWRPDIPVAQRWLPRHPRITRVRLTEAVKSVLPGALVLHTGLFIQRSGLTEFLSDAQPVSIEFPPEETSQIWEGLAAQFKDSVRRADGRRSWRLIESSADEDRCTDQFLSRTGKSQDGIVSRYLNRPISRFVSRYLLCLDVTPITWTLAFFALPVVAFFCLSRGDYIGIAGGALLFQLYSILDGCDGEIARATYQESERGGRIDDFLDMLGSMLFVIGLGIGLFRSESSVYLLEGFVCASVIATNEWFLRRVTVTDRPESQQLADALYPRHRRLFAHPILAKLGGKQWWWIIQFTKRDFAILLFLVLALLGRPQWILHLWLTVSGITLALSARSSGREKSRVESGT